MQIITECNLALLVSEILNGKTVVFPTETSYGLGCDATNQAAVDKIYQIKNRNKSKSLLVVVPEIEAAKKYLQWNETLEKIAVKYWPGPLTIIAEAKGGLARGVVSETGMVAIRVTAFSLLKSITEILHRPLVATSANISGSGDLYDSKKVIKMFGEEQMRPDFVLDYGLLPEKKPSTIIQIENNSFKIIRQGELNVEL